MMLDLGSIQALVESERSVIGVVKDLASRLDSTHRQSSSKLSPLLHKEEGGQQDAGKGWLTLLGELGQQATQLVATLEALALPPLGDAIAKIKTEGRGSGGRSRSPDQRQPDKQGGQGDRATAAEEVAKAEAHKRKADEELERAVLNKEELVKRFGNKLAAVVLDKADRRIQAAFANQANAVDQLARATAELNAPGLRVSGSPDEVDKLESLEAARLNAMRDSLRGWAKALHHFREDFTVSLDEYIRQVESFDPAGDMEHFLTKKLKVPPAEARRRAERYTTGAGSPLARPPSPARFPTADHGPRLDPLDGSLRQEVERLQRELDDRDRQVAVAKADLNRAQDDLQKVRVREVTLINQNDILKSEGTMLKDKIRQLESKRTSTDAALPSPPATIGSASRQQHPRVGAVDGGGVAPMAVDTDRQVSQQGVAGRVTTPPMSARGGGPGHGQAAHQAMGDEDDSTTPAHMAAITSARQRLRRGPSQQRQGQQQQQQHQQQQQGGARGDWAGEAPSIISSDNGARSQSPVPQRAVTDQARLPDAAIMTQPPQEGQPRHGDHQQQREASPSSPELAGMIDTGIDMFFTSRQESPPPGLATAPHPRTDAALSTRPPAGLRTTQGFEGPGGPATAARPGWRRQETGGFGQQRSVSSGSTPPTSRRGGSAEDFHTATGAAAPAAPPAVAPPAKVGVSDVRQSAGRSSVSSPQASVPHLDLKHLSQAATGAAGDLRRKTDDEGRIYSFSTEGQGTTAAKHRYYEARQSSRLSDDKGPPGPASAAVGAVLSEMRQRADQLMATWAGGTDDLADQRKKDTFVNMKRMSNRRATDKWVEVQQQHEERLLAFCSHAEAARPQHKDLKGKAGEGSEGGGAAAHRDWFAKDFYKGSAVLERHIDLPVGAPSHTHLAPAKPIKLSSLGGGVQWGSAKMDDLQWSCLSYEVLLLGFQHLVTQTAAKTILLADVAGADDTPGGGRRGDKKMDKVARMEHEAIVDLFRSVVTLMRVRLGIPQRLHEMIVHLTLPDANELSGSSGGGASTLHPMDLRYRVIRLIESWQHASDDNPDKPGQRLGGQKAFRDWVSRQLHLLGLAFLHRVQRLYRFVSPSKAPSTSARAPQSDPAVASFDARPSALRFYLEEGAETITILQDALDAGHWGTTAPSPTTGQQATRSKWASRKGLYRLLHCMTCIERLDANIRSRVALTADRNSPDTARPSSKSGGRRKSHRRNPQEGSDRGSSASEGDGSSPGKALPIEAEESRSGSASSHSPSPEPRPDDRKKGAGGRHMSALPSTSSSGHGGKGVGFEDEVSDGAHPKRDPMRRRATRARTATGHLGPAAAPGDESGKEEPKITQRRKSRRNIDGILTEDGVWFGRHSYWRYDSPLLQLFFSYLYRACTDSSSPSRLHLEAPRIARALVICAHMAQAGRVAPSPRRPGGGGSGKGGDPGPLLPCMALDTHAVLCCQALWREVAKAGDDADEFADITTDEASQETGSIVVPPVAAVESLQSIIGGFSAWLFSDFDPTDVPPEKRQATPVGRIISVVPRSLGAGLNATLVVAMPQAQHTAAAAQVPVTEEWCCLPLEAATQQEGKPKRLVGVSLSSAGRVERVVYELCLRRSLAGVCRDEMAAVLSDYRLRLEPESLRPLLTVWTKMQGMMRVKISGMPTKTDTKQDGPAEEGGGRGAKKMFEGGLSTGHSTSRSTARASRREGYYDRPLSEILNGPSIQEDILRYFVCSTCRGMFHRLFDPVMAAIQLAQNAATSLKMLRTDQDNPSQEDQEFDKERYEVVSSFGTAMESFVNEVRCELQYFAPVWRDFLPDNQHPAIVMYTGRFVLHGAMKAMLGSPYWADTDIPPGGEKVIKNVRSFELLVGQVRLSTGVHLPSEPDLMDLLAPVLAATLANRFRSVEDVLHRCIANEQWRPIAPPDVLHSSSVIDLFSFVFQIFEAMMDLNPPLDWFLPSLLSFLSRLTSTYCGALRRQCDGVGLFKLRPRCSTNFQTLVDRFKEPPAAAAAAAKSSSAPTKPTFMSAAKGPVPPVRKSTPLTAGQQALLRIFMPSDKIGRDTSGGESDTGAESGHEAGSDSDDGEGGNKSDTSSPGGGRWSSRRQSKHKKKDKQRGKSIMRMSFFGGVGVMRGLSDKKEGEGDQGADAEETEGKCNCGAVTTALLEVPEYVLRQSLPEVLLRLHNLHFFISQLEQIVGKFMTMAKKDAAVSDPLIAPIRTALNLPPSPTTQHSKVKDGAGRSNKQQQQQGVGESDASVQQRGEGMGRMVALASVESMEEVLREGIDKCVEIVHSTAFAIARYVASRMVYVDLQSAFFMDLYAPSLQEAPFENVVLSFRQSVNRFFTRTPAAFRAPLLQQFLLEVAQAWMWVVVCLGHQGQMFESSELGLLYGDLMALKNYAHELHIDEAVPLPPVASPYLPPRIHTVETGRRDSITSPGGSRGKGGNKAGPPDSIRVLEHISAFLGTLEEKPDCLVAEGGHIGGMLNALDRGRDADATPHEDTETQQQFRSTPTQKRKTLFARVAGATSGSASAAANDNGASAAGDASGGEETPRGDKSSKKWTLTSMTRRFTIWKGPSGRSKSPRRDDSGGNDEGHNPFGAG